MLVTFWMLLNFSVYLRIRVYSGAKQKRVRNETDVEAITNKGRVYLPFWKSTHRNPFEQKRTESSFLQKLIELVNHESSNSSKVELNMVLENAIR